MIDLKYMKYVVTFHTHADGIRYQRFLKSQNTPGSLRPTPRVLSSSCGVCMFFESDLPYEKIKTDFFIEGCDKIFTNDNNSYKLL